MSSEYAALRELAGLMFESAGAFGCPEFHGYVRIGGVNYKFTTLCKDDPHRRRWEIKLSVAQWPQTRGRAE